MKSKTKANVEAKEYIQSVFEEKLKSNGFVASDDKLLSWYRITCQEIINFVGFFTCESGFTKFPVVGYGIHPLFHMPVHIPRFVYPERSCCREEMEEQYLVMGTGASSSGCCMTLHQAMLERQGGYTLDNIIFPQMEKITTVEACYERHKKNRLTPRYEDHAVAFYNLSDIFIDEAFYVEDTEVYPYCERYIIRSLEWVRKACEEQPKSKSARERLRQWEERQRAFSDNDRAGYLHILEKRKAETIAYLGKRIGVSL